MKSKTIILLLTAAATLPLRGATLTWDAGAVVGNNWASAANWDLNTLPVAGDTLVFPAGIAATGKATINNFAAGTNFAGIQFESDGYSVAGNTFNLGAGGIDISLSAAAAAISITPGITLSAGSTWNIADSDDLLTLSGSVNLNGVQLFIIGDGNVALNGGLSGTGAGSVLRIGAGGSATEVLLDNAASFSHAGQTLVQNGRLIVNGVVSASTVVSTITGGGESGLVGGKGAVHTLSATGGTIAPGAAFAGTGTPAVLHPGTLTVTNGGLSMTAASSMDISLSTPTVGTGFSRLVVTGPVSVNGTLTVGEAATFQPAIGDVFHIIVNDGADAVTGTFTGLTEGATVTGDHYKYTISYVANSAGAGAGNDVALTVSEVLPTGVTKNWTGAVSNSQATAGNWSPSLPVNGDTVQFPAATPNFTVVTNAAVFNDLVVNDLILNGNYTFDGNAPWNVLDDVRGDAGAGTTTFNVPVKFMASATSPLLEKQTAGTMIFNDVVTNLSAGQLIFLPFEAASSLIFNGDIVAASSSLRVGNTNGSALGRVVFSGDKTFTGLLTVNPGVTVEAQNNGSLGTTGQGTTVSGTLKVGPGGIIPAARTYAEPFTVNETGRILARNGVHTLTGTVSAPDGGDPNLVAGLETEALLDSLTLSGVLSGFQASIRGPGQVTLSGAAGNTLTSGIFVTSGARLAMNKTAGNAATGDVLRAAGGTATWLRANQVADTVRLDVQDGGTLNLNNFSDTVDDLDFLSQGTVSTGTGTLAVAGDVHRDSPGAGAGVMSGKITFTAATPVWDVEDSSAVDDISVEGVLTGTGSNKARKIGAGLVHLQQTSSDGSSLDFDVEAGTIRVDSESLGTDIVLKGATARLEGFGRVGNVTASTGGGTIEPIPAVAGNVAVLDVNDLLLNSSTTLRFKLGIVGGDARSDIVEARGACDLGNATLTLIPIGAAPAVGDSFRLISRGGIDPPVTGTFNGFPEGSTVLISGQEYKLTYVGGDFANDVMLTRFEPNSGFTRTWDGGGADNNWATAANWVGDVAPGAGDALIFPTTAARRTNTNNFPAGRTFRSLSVSGATYTIGGAGIVLNEGLSVSGTQVLNLPLAASLPQTWSVSSNSALTVGGAVDLNTVLVTMATNAIGVARPSDMIITGNITSTGGGAFAEDGTLSKTGSGTLTLSGANDIEELHLEAGTTIATASSALGGASGVLVLVQPGATLSLEGAAPFTLARGISNRGTIIQPAGAPNHTLFGLLIMDAAAARIAVNGGTLFHTSELRGTNGVTVTGAGTLELGGTAANTYTGTFTRTGGGLRLNKTAGTANITGDLVVTNAAADAALNLDLVTANQIADTAVVTLQRAGGLIGMVLGGSETVGSLDLTGSTILTGANTLTLSTGDIVTRASANGSSVIGLMNFGDTACSLDVEDGAAATDFILQGTFAGVASRTHTKTGLGKVQFSSGTFGSAGTGIISLNEGEFQLDGTVGSNVDVRLSGGTLSGGGTLGALVAQAPGGIVSPGASPADLVTRNITLNAQTTLRMEILNTTPGTGYDQIKTDTVGGVHNIALGGATLEVSTLPGYAPVVGQVFTIIDNVSTGTTTGTFAGLADAATIDAGAATFRINYGVGTNTNDVTLTVTAIGSTGITRVWSGAGADNNWLTAANWVPLPAQPASAPGTGDSLRFPAGAARKSNSNNFAAGTTFDRIIFEDGGYTLTGNAITMNSGITTTAAVNSAVSFGLPLTFSADQTWEIDGGSGSLGLTSAATVNLNGKRFDIRTGIVTTLGGVVSGNSAGGIFKTGPRPLGLDALNTYASVTHVIEGSLRIINSGSLGSTSGNTVVEAGASLTYGGVTPLNVPEPITLRGTLDSADAGFDHTFSGDIALDGAARVHVLVAARTMFLSGRISGSSLSSLQKTGPGTVQLSGTVSNTWAGGLGIIGGKVQLNKTAGVVSLPCPVALLAGTTLEALTDNQVNNAVSITFNGAGTYLSRTDTIGGIIFNGGTVNTAPGVLTLQGEIETNVAGGTSSIAGTLALITGEHRWNIYDTAGVTTDLQVSAVVQGPGSIRKEGIGRVVFSGNNTLPLITATEGETQLTGVNTPTAISQTGGTLSGQFTCANLTSTGGIIAPGTTADPTGTITVNGPVTLGSGTTYQFQAEAFASAQIDRINANGAVTLNNPALALEFLGGFVPTIGQVFSIIDNISIGTTTGAFSGLPQGAHIAAPGPLVFRASYTGGTGNDVTLTQVAEVLPTLDGLSLAPAGGGNPPGSISATYRGLGMPGLKYRLEQNDDLGPTHWIPVPSFGEATANNLGEVNFGLEILPPSRVRRFYRTVLVP